PALCWLCCCFLILPLSCGLPFQGTVLLRAQVCAGVFSCHQAAHRGGGTGTEARPRQLSRCDRAGTWMWKKAPQQQGGNSTQSWTFRLKGKEDFLFQHL
ncbi:hypothetical protein CIB84_013563, partial [Bambusicola thoracicus]